MESPLTVVNEQVEDAGLWFVAQTAAEGYLQQALRRLHAAVERKSPEQCALDAGLSDELTQGMVEAGAHVLCGFETETAGEEYWAKEVYRAMRAAKSE